MIKINLKIIVLILGYLLSYGCSRDINEIIHLGKNSETQVNIVIDTIETEIYNSSAVGNFFVKDSIVTFVDAVTCEFYDYTLSGRYLGTYFQKGRGRNEISSLMYAYPIENDSNERCLIVDNSNMISSYRLEEKKISKNGVVDFGWENRKTNKFHSPSIYNILAFSDFGVRFNLVNDETVMFPISIINRNTKSADYVIAQRYDSGAIFGELDLKSMRVKRVFGKFPNIYKTNPTPHLETFDYAIKSDTIYVNHTIDSLIYVYKYPDKLLYTIGYECKNIGRNYTHTKNIDVMGNFKIDIQNCGLNSGLLLCSNNTLCRSYFKSAKSGECGLQVYDINTNNLIMDINVPNYFKLLTYKDGYYYGVNFTPKECDDSTILQLYRIKIN
ncbi:MAG: hypothetical protein R3Y26_09900 [Rikenellaceae bacterium]